MWSKRFAAARSGLFLREMALALLLGASLHFGAVTWMYVRDGFPAHDRIGYIYFIGVIQIGVGLLDLLAYRLLTIDRTMAARVGWLGAIIISGYAVIISPVYPNFSFLFKLAPPAYLIYHWWVVIRLRAGNTPLRLRDPLEHIPSGGRESARRED
jgi:hypothetical protein